MKIGCSRFSFENTLGVLINKFCEIVLGKEEMDTREKTMQANAKINCQPSSRDFEYKSSGPSTNFFVIVIVTLLGQNYEVLTSFYL